MTRFKNLHAAFLLLIAAGLVFAGGNTEEPVKASVSGEGLITRFKVSSPPDPNIIPIAVLAAKAQEWMPGVEIEIVTSPGGDPGATKAMAQNRSVDFALFNALSGSKFYSAGLTNVRLIGVHVWKGVYLLAQNSIKDLSQLEGETLLAVPSIMTPPHLASQKALQVHGINVDFIPGGAGPSLFALLSQQNRAPLAFAAPEPFVSIILAKQKKEEWETRYHIIMDPQAELNPETERIPLGSLWLINDDLVSSKPKAVRTFVDSFARANEYVNNPDNYDEVSQIVANTLAKVYGEGAGAPIFRMMLESGRLDLEFLPAEDIQNEVTANLKRLYKFDVDSGVFIILP